MPPTHKTVRKGSGLASKLDLEMVGKVVSLETFAKKGETIRFATGTVAELVYDMNVRVAFPSKNKKPFGLNTEYLELVVYDGAGPGTMSMEELLTRCRQGNVDEIP
jgi:hypothetical protein